GRAEDLPARMDRERRVVLLPGESLLLRRGDDLAVDQNGSGAIVVIRRYAEDGAFHDVCFAFRTRFTTRLEQRVDERCDRRPCGHGEYRSEREQDDDNRHQPELLALTEKAPEICQKLHLLSPSNTAFRDRGR